MKPEIHFLIRLRALARTTSPAMVSTLPERTSSSRRSASAAQTSRISASVMGSRLSTRRSARSALASLGSERTTSVIFSTGITIGRGCSGQVAGSTSGSAKATRGRRRHRAGQRAARISSTRSRGALARSRCSAGGTELPRHRRLILAATTGGAHAGRGCLAENCAPVRASETGDVNASPLRNTPQSPTVIPEGGAASSASQTGLRSTRRASALFHHVGLFASSLMSNSAALRNSRTSTPASPGT